MNPNNVLGTSSLYTLFNCHFGEIGTPHETSIKLSVLGTSRLFTVFSVLMNSKKKNTGTTVGARPMCSCECTVVLSS